MIQTECSVVEILFYLKKKELALLSLIANGANFDYSKFSAKYDQRWSNVEHTRAIRRRLKLRNCDRHKMMRKKKRGKWMEGPERGERRSWGTQAAFANTNHKDPLLFNQTTSSNSYFLAKFLFPPLRLWSVERALSLLTATLTVIDDVAKYFEMTKILQVRCNVTVHCISIYRRANWLKQWRAKRISNFLLERRYLKEF